MAGGKLAGVAQSRSWGTVIRRLLLHVICIPLLAAVLGGIAYSVLDHIPRYGSGHLETVTLADLRGKDVLWVDARPQAEYDLAHMRGAVLLNQDEWSKLLPGFISQWSDQTVVVYCGANCSDSRGVARRLRTELEVTEIYILEGGWDAVKASGNVQYLER